MSRQGRDYEHSMSARLYGAWWLVDELGGAQERKEALCCVALRQY